MSVKAFFSMEFWSVFAIAFTAINVTNGNKASGMYRRLHIDEDPDFMNIDAIQATAATPWPHTEKDNLCLIVKARNLTATIVMAYDAKYGKSVERCIKKGKDPVSINTGYADAHGYSLRVYIDEDNPFLMKHGKNALQGELRKIVALADSMRPSGPVFGHWTTNVHHVLPDLVMWVDGDAAIYGLPHKLPLSLEEVVRRSCSRAEWPEDYVRVIGQDSGNTVNAGWYIISSGTFGSHLLKYILELLEVYGPCEMWGQHIIQEALLKVMAGAPPPWPIVLPCSGQEGECLTDAVAGRLMHECRYDRGCFLANAAAWVNTTKAHSLARAGASLNRCFGRLKFEYAPNARSAWSRYANALNTTRQGNSKPGCNSNTDLNCCQGMGQFASPGCTGRGSNKNSNESTVFWGAAGSGVVLLPEKDGYVKFNSMKQQTSLLWHHGHNRFIPASCS